MTQDLIEKIAWTNRFLRDAVNRRILAQAAYEPLADELRRRAVSARGVHTELRVPVTPLARPVPPVPPVSAEPAPAGRWLVSPAVLERGAQPRVAPAPPGVASAALARVASDVGVHGLAYLGVLLTFVGTLGFVLFAFSGVNPWLRPVAETLVPLALFGSSAFLRGRGAPFASASLEVLGGLLTPVVVFASFADGVPFPPDASRGALVAAVAASSVALAFAYDAVARRRPQSLLRYLVAPLAWTAAGALGLAFDAGASAAQGALVASAIACTAVLARLVPGHRLAGPARVVCAPGAAAACALTFLVGVPEGLPAVPVAVAGVASLVTIDLVAGRRAAVLQAVVAAATAGALVPSLGAGPAGLAAVVAAIALVERNQVREPSDDGAPALAALAGVAAIGLAAAAGRTWTLALTWAVAAAWANVRVLSGAALRDVPGHVVAGAAALLPLGAAAGVHALLYPGPAWVACGGAVLALAAAARGVPHRPLYSWWVPAAAFVVGTGVLASRGDSTDADLAAAAALAGVAAALTRERLVAAVWASSAGFASALGLAMSAAGVAHGVRPVVWASAGTALAAAATAWQVSARRSPVAGIESPERGGAIVARSAAAEVVAPHLAGVGALAGFAAVVAAPAGGARVACLALWTVTWLGAVVTREVSRSPLVDLWSSVVGDRAARVASVVILSASVPALALSAFDVALPLAIGACALVTAIAGRLVAGRVPLGRALSDSAFGLSLVAAASNVDAVGATVFALAASIGCALAAGPLRRFPATWFAWGASGVLVAIGAAGLEPAAVRVLLLVWAAGCAALVARRVVAAPALGLATALVVPFTAWADAWQFAALALGCVGVWAAAALLLRNGAFTAPAYAMGVVAVASVAPAGVDVQLVLVAAAAALGAVAGLLSRVPAGRGLERWDVAAGAVALATIAGTATAGPGWASFSLAVFAVVCGVAAGRVPAFEGVVLRYASVTFIALSAGLAAVATHAGIAGRASGAAFASLAATVVALALHERDERSVRIGGARRPPRYPPRETHPWIGPAACFAVAACAASVWTALADWPSRTLLVGALASAGAQCVAAGLVLRRRGFLVAAPAVLCASWLVFASDALHDAQWFTIPVGIALAVIVEIARRGSGFSDELVALDWIAMGFAAAPALLATAVDSLGYALVAVAVGLALAAFGVVTRVRRRLAAGGATVCLAALLLIAVPLAELLPRFRGVALWAAVATVGLGLIAAATSLEQGRTRVRHALRRLADVTEGWE